MNKEQYEGYINFAKDKLGFEFKEPELLITALTHRSYVNEHKKSVKEHNERLEFLGDAVLELVSTDFLYRNYSEPEGILTAWRAALVRTESLSAAGEELGYGSLVRVSKGEKNGPERGFQVILADAFEALIGAIYLDQGYDVAKDFIAKHILTKMDSVLETGSWRDAKSHLQEVSQHQEGVAPEYRVLREDGPDHDKTFVVGVYVRGRMMGRGSGSSKQAAQQIAAAEALEKYK